MKKIFILYIITALLNSWIIIFMLGISAGFASYVPVAALGGSIILFVLAAPVLVYRYYTGLFLGLIGYLLILPNNLLLIRGIFEDGVFNWGILLDVIPTGLTFLGIYCVTKVRWVKSGSVPMVIHNRIIKILLAGLPVFLFILYVLLYGKYWKGLLIVMK